MRLRVVLFCLVMLSWPLSSARGQSVDGLEPSEAPETTDAVSDPRGRASRLEIPSATSIPLPGPVDPRRYQVGPGDVFRLIFSGSLTRQVVVTVGPEGSLALPGAGALQVAQLSLDETRERVVERLRRDYRGVQVDLRLERPRVFRVFLTGRVQQPGELEATALTSLAGILTPERLEQDASRRGIQLRRRDGSLQVADLGAFLATGDATALPTLSDGDVIHVPVATEFLHVFGAVASPGRVERAPGDSLATLLRMVGGLQPSAADGAMLWLHWSERATRPESIWVDHSDPSATSALVSDGDRLYVYFQAQYREQREVAVVGEVRRPGQFPITEGRTRLSEILRDAGGLLTTADPSAIHVHRTHPGQGERDIELERLLRLSRDELTASEYEALRTKLAAQREDYRVDLATLTQGDGRLDLPLRQGDIIRVDRLVNTVRVDGQVRRPAIVTHEAGLRVADYIRASGGYTNRAWAGKARITRAVNGQTLLAREVSTLDPGDFLWVPEKPDESAWMRAQQILTALAQVATVVIAIRSVR